MPLGNPIKLGDLAAIVQSARNRDELCDIMDKELFANFEIEFKTRRDEVDYEKLKKDVRGLACCLVFGPLQGESYAEC